MHQSVDFGTTFTSVAFAHSSSPDEVKLVRTWLNSRAGDETADQVPSEVHYKNPITRERIWGYEIQDVTTNKGVPEALKWFKLLLQGQSAPSAFARLSISEPEPAAEDPSQATAIKLRKLNIRPVEVVTDFLASVRRVALASIKDTYGEKKEIKVQYVLTIPAIWKDMEKSLMIQASENAGFGTHRVDFELVGEPESAAAYTLKAIQPNNLDNGDTFVICDAGGGTVDLVSYKITQLNPLRLDEVVSGTGGRHGSVFLDHGFEQYIRNKLGDAAIDSMKPRCKNEMMRTWVENVKLKFGNRTAFEYDVSVHGVPDDEDTNVEDGFHSMDLEDVKGIFDPVVDPIVKLVTHQVQSVQRKGYNVKAILLVGGFGSSAYLLQRLQNTRYGGKVLQVLQPPNARTAIARGALMRGLDGSVVKEKRSRRHYGFEVQAPFIADKGWDKHKCYNWIEEKWFVDGKLLWFLHKNDKIGDTMSASFKVYRVFDNLPRNLIFTVELRACDTDDSPEFIWMDPTALYSVCSVEADLSSIPRNKFRKMRNSSGDDYYEVHFTVCMSLTSDVLKFEVLFEGKPHGIATARFE
ncbi:hypothetical protein FN846DRAFT_916415 [Sphaerosporella brunnea]|uniref:Actin-like ATPase domain-containing protein n=1 Tax=Sphaerosporella brunnea TaxID=1250544 RepID=A0A5J5F8H8_9PEZI|nr:hypothetical protein FN846DRAFT_916415 [Sphaerosporella brunnea]